MPLAFTALWAATLLLHGHFFLVRTPPSFPIFDTITHQPLVGTNGTTLEETNTTATITTGTYGTDLHPPAWYSILSSSWLFPVLKLFALQYISTITSRCYSDFRKGGKLEISKYLQDSWRIPLRALAAAYVLEYLVREITLLAVAAELDEVLGLRSQEDLKAVLKFFVKF